MTQERCDEPDGRWGQPRVFLENLEGRILLDGTSFWPQHEIYPSLSDPKCLATADLNGDGDLDVVVASGADHKVAWYENLGGGVFGDRRIVTSTAAGVTLVVTADMNGDGDVDVLYAAPADGKIAWVENLGGGSFAAERVVAANGGSVVGLSVADVDGDGRQDVISASQSTYAGAVGRIVWYRNVGAGEFSEARVVYAPDEWTAGQLHP